ncbi:MAG: suppressor of fused domain protein [Phycisphaerae bacterium]
MSAAGGGGKRDHWLYVSSGMSNPWGDSPETAKPEGLSGLGFELTLHTREPGRWALELVQWLMAVQLLVAGGELQGGILEYDDRVQFRRGKDSGDVSRLLVARPTVELMGYPESFQLASGRVDVMTLVGISEREAEFAKSQNPEGLVTVLRHHEVWPLTSLKRVSVV